MVTNKQIEQKLLKDILEASKIETATAVNTLTTFREGLQRDEAPEPPCLDSPPRVENPSRYEDLSLQAATCALFAVIEKYEVELAYTTDDNGVWLRNKSEEVNLGWTDYEADLPTIQSLKFLKQ